MPDSDKQVVESDQKEAVPHASVQPQPQETLYPKDSGNNDKAPRPQKIFLWIIIPLTMLLLGSAIGGGVGGSLAVRHARLVI
jgi:hypothetical protein